MAAKKSPALEFTRQYLKKKPDVSFAEVRDAAAEQGLKIYPIVYGRAKALEGLIQIAPYGSKKKARLAKELAKSKAAAVAGKAAGSSVNPAGTGGSLKSIDAVIKGMRENHEERERYRQALIKISEILDEIL